MASASQTELPKVTLQEETRAQVCQICLYPSVEEGYELPLCWDCRRRGSLRPLPRAIKLMCALVVIALTYAGYCYFETLGALIAYQEGQRAEKVKDFDHAAEDYEAVVAFYPDSPLVEVRLGLAYYRGGHIPEAIGILGNLWGMRTPKEVAIQVNAVFQEIKRRAGVT